VYVLIRTWRCGRWFRLFPGASRVDCRRAHDFVAFADSCHADALAAAAAFAAFYKRTKRVIKLISVQQILDEQHVDKM
jgi:hypothetical protein